MSVTIPATWVSNRIRLEETILVGCGLDRLDYGTTCHVSASHRDSSMPATLDRLAGPKGHWLRGNLSQFVAGRLGFLEENFQKYGDAFLIRLGPKRILVVSHPDLVEEVLVTKNRCFIKHFALRRTKLTLGNGLLTSEGDFWRRQRKLAQPAFHREKIAQHAAMMVAYTERMLSSWRDGQARDAQDDMMQLTLEIVAKALFDAEVQGESARASVAMNTVMAAFTARVGKMIHVPEWIPTPVNLRLQRAVRQLDEIVFRMISDRRRTGEDPGDLLSMLLNAQDEDGGGMTDRQLRDEVMTLFMAGHETTANTLAWIWYLLAGHPEVEAKLHEELDRVLGGRSPTMDDLPNLPYTDQVVTETLRLYSTVWLIGREAVEACTIGGHAVPVGWTVYMSQWIVHRDPRWFDDPLSFRPERWSDGLMKRIPRYAYFPFGGGPRLCIGNNFALMETALLLATIAQRFRLQLAPDANVVPLPTMTLRPEFGVRVVLQGRSS
ncbi:MAG: cytochrome [Planctomycetota bacterium]|nr:cytochrome [Planctomycetota bacterium]